MYGVECPTIRIFHAGCQYLAAEWALWDVSIWDVSICDILHNIGLGWYEAPNLNKRGWIVEPVPFIDEPSQGATRRSFVRRVTLAVFAAVPVLRAVASPAAAFAYIPCTIQNCVPEYLQCNCGVLVLVEICWDVRTGAACQWNSYVIGEC